MGRVWVDGIEYDGFRHTPVHGPFRRDDPTVAQGAASGFGALSTVLRAAAVVRTCPAPCVCVAFLAWLPGGADLVGRTWRPMWDGEGWERTAAVFSVIAAFAVVQGAWVGLAGLVRRRLPGWNRREPRLMPWPAYGSGGP